MVLNLAGAELERVAGIYAQAARRLIDSSEMGEEYIRQLRAAREVEWESSSAAEAYRMLLYALELDGRDIDNSAYELAAEAYLIAVDLYEAAEKARTVGSLLGSMAGQGAAGLVGSGGSVLSWAEEALSSSGEFMRFLNHFGDIPSVLYTAGERG